MAATDIERGLSTAEVKERIAAGKINRNMELKTKSVSYTHLDVYKRQDLAYVRELGAGLDEQVVVDLEAKRAHDVEVELGEQVVDGVDLSLIHI